MNIDLFEHLYISQTFIFPFFACSLVGVVIEVLLSYMTYLLIMSINAGLSGKCSAIISLFSQWCQPHVTDFEYVNVNFICRSSSEPFLSTLGYLLF